MHLQSADDVSASAPGGENLQIVVDLTSSSDSDVSPRSPLEDGKFSTENDLTERSPSSRELCLTEGNCTCRESRQFCSGNCTVSPAVMPKLRKENVDRNSHQQSMNGVRDVGLLKSRRQSATATDCTVSVTGALTDECHEGLVIPTNVFPSLDPAVAGRVISGGSIVQDCS